MTAAPATSTGVDAHDRALVARLRERSTHTLAPLLREADAPFALVDFPFHENVGDSMIWLGERQLLRECGVEIAYACDARSYDRAELRRRIGDGTILLHGGGNVGDLWPHHQALRERVIADFPGNRIVQLPQTMHFEQAEALAQARRVFESHPRFTLLLRDQVSLDAANDAFEVPAQLCPDSAFHLGPLPLPVAAPEGADDIVWLARSDHEARGDTLMLAAGVRATDWPARRRRSLRDPGDFAARILIRALLTERTARGHRVAAPAPSSLRTVLYDHFAIERLDTGSRALAAGRVVVTDRMHGHVLCVLLGMPHVVLPDRYGKVRALWDTWTHTSATAHWAGTTVEALAIARDLVAAERARA